MKNATSRLRAWDKANALQRPTGRCTQDRGAAPVGFQAYRDQRDWTARSMPPSIKASWFRCGTPPAEPGHRPPPDTRPSDADRRPYKTGRSGQLVAEVASAAADDRLCRQVACFTSAGDVSSPFEFFQAAVSWLDAERPDRDDLHHQQPDHQRHHAGDAAASNSITTRNGVTMVAPRPSVLTIPEARKRTSVGNSSGM